MKLKSKKDQNYSVQVHSRKDAEYVIKKLIELGFKNNQEWNDEQLNDKWYDEYTDEIFICIENNTVQMHTHDCELKVISFEEWSNLPEYDPKEVAFKNFVLPKKWCVNGSKELGKYFKEINVINLSGTYIDKYYYIAYDGKWDCRVSLDGMSLITFEQFKEHVLGKKLNENKRLIGYKLVKEEYKESVKAIINRNDWFHNFDMNLAKNGFNFSYSEEIGSINEIIKTSGVLDIWFEPVYEGSKESKIMDFLAEKGIEINIKDAEEIINIVNKK